MTEASSSLVPECSVCAEELDDPRVLPCGHSYCGPHKNCLSLLKQNTGSLKCALCNEVHFLNINNLKPLFGIRDFLQQTNAKIPGSKPTKTLPVFSRCPTHPSAAVQFWCVQCSEKLCMACFETTHDGHAMKSYKVHLQHSVGNKLKEMGPQRETFMDNISKRIDDIQEQIGALNNRIQSCEEKKGVLEKEIEKLDNIRLNEAKIRSFGNGNTAEIEGALLDCFLNLSNDSQASDPYVAFLSGGITLCSEFAGLRSWTAGEQHDSDGVIVSRGYKLWIRAKRFRSGPEKYYLGLFLGCQPIVPEVNWTFNVDFELTLVNTSSSKNKKLCTSHTFRAHEDDWGWNSFMDWTQVLSPTLGWINEAKQSVTVHCTLTLSQ